MTHLTPAIVLPYKDTVPSISSDAFIAQNAVLIGDVEIGFQSSIWYGCVLRGDVNNIRIGEKTNIQDGTVIHVSSQGQGAYLGDCITVGHMALVHACTVEDHAFIGMKACVMDDCYIESAAMVAAGSLVTPGKRIKAGELWAGNPARFKRHLSEEDQIRMNYVSTHYAELGQEYLTRFRDTSSKKPR
ncbi:MAG: gamma carbonic anhydrase family protein [SAR324 cluster bacterium]|nr:gamma carbonic anhydrase family protein [SAR324 cluster bacterium]